MNRNIITKISQLDNALQIDWQDGHQSTFHYIWLRDNDARTGNSLGQQSNDTFKIPLDIKPADVTFNGTLDITWSNDGSISHLDPTWLRANTYEETEVDKRRPLLNLWQTMDIANPLTQYSYDDIVNGERVMRDMLQHLRDFGFAILSNVPVESGMVLEVLSLFGYAMETHHNKMWEIKVIPSSEDIGDTENTLPGHIDQPYRHSAPTITMLHFMANSVDGGDSTLVDGFRLAADLRNRDPDAFKMLTTTSVTYLVQDEKTALECQGPIIEIDERHEATRIRMNPFSIQPFYVSPYQMMDFYAAYQTLGRMVDDDMYKLTIKLDAGNLLLIDNLRMLHGRVGYKSSGGERLLQGCFSRQDDFWSKLAILNQKFT